MWQQFIIWLEKNLATCTFQKHFGMCCPGCGFQNSLIALFKGDISESIHLYPALLPILSLVTLSFLHLKFKFSWGTITLKILFLISIILVLRNYLQKILF